METNTAVTARQPWNNGKFVGQKAPFKLKEIWAIRIRLQIAKRCRELALFNLAVDSKLRACDLMQLRVRDVCMVRVWRPEPSSFNKRLIDRCSSRSPSQHARPWPLGFPNRSLKRRIFYSLAASTPRHIYRRASMRELSIHGFFSWDWTRPIMAPTRFEERRPR
jgi:hypothetical protein